MSGIVAWMKKSVLLYNEIFVVLTIKNLFPCGTQRCRRGTDSLVILVIS